MEVGVRNRPWMTMSCVQQTEDGQEACVHLGAIYVRFALTPRV